MNRIRPYASSRPQDHAASTTDLSGYGLLQKKRASRDASDQIGERDERFDARFLSRPNVTNHEAENRKNCFIPPVVEEVDKLDEDSGQRPVMPCPADPLAGLRQGNRSDIGVQR